MASRFQVREPALVPETNLPSFRTSKTRCEDPRTCRRLSPVVGLQA